MQTVWSCGNSNIAVLSKTVVGYDDDTCFLLIELCRGLAYSGDSKISLMTRGVVLKLEVGGRLKGL